MARLSEQHQRVADLAAMLGADNAAMRKAGGALAEAAVHVIHNYDGLHRLSLAVAEWQRCIANEGGRDRRAALAETE